MGQLEILTVLVLFVAIFTNYMVFSSSTFNVGFTPIYAVVFLFLSIGAIYWIFFTPSGKAYARKYNTELRKAAEEQAQEIKNYYRNRVQVFSDIDGFSPSHSVFSIDNKSAISIDENSKNICLISKPIGSTINLFDIRHRKVISYRDILEVAIFEDGNSTTTTSRTSQVAGAVIGNIMLGGAGLLIGALTGSKKTSETVNSFEVRLIINDTKSPTWSIAFIRSETPKKSPVYKKAANEANNLLGLIKVLIKRADDEDKLTESQQINPAPPLEKKLSVLELAKGGDPGAITSLLNRSLNKKGITAKARMRGNTLRISLASEVIPDPDHIVPMIHKGIMGLNIDGSTEPVMLMYQETQKRRADASPTH